MKPIGVDSKMEDKKRPQRVSKNLWAKMKPLVLEKQSNPTPAEKQLWQLIRNRQIDGLKFRRQYVIENYIVDFYCAELKLIIEVDGEIHDKQQIFDAVRQERLEAHGTIVLRFRNEQNLNMLSKQLKKQPNQYAKQTTQTPPLYAMERGQGGEVDS